MTVSNLRELFVHDLRDIYDAEPALVDALSELDDQTTDDRLAAVFRDHESATETHVDRLEQVFELLDEPPQRAECEAMHGLFDEHVNFVEQDVDAGVLDLHNLVTAQKIEQYEIAAYGHLAVVADRLELADAASLLEATLQEERDTLDTLLTHGGEFDYDALRDSMAAE